MSIDLEQLSREAAGCLPEPITDSNGCRFVNGYAGSEWAVNGIWLHESTEACTEIMVRVLWPRGVWFMGEGSMVHARHDQRGWLADIPKDADPMLAFRVAVLRALVALKKG